MRRKWWFATLLAALVSFQAVPGHAGSATMPDSCDRPPRTRAPYTQLLKARKSIAAADTARSILASLESRSGVDSLTIACALLDRVGLGLGVPGDYAEFDALLARAVSIARRDVARDSLFLLRAIYHEGELHRYRSRYREADSTLHVALAMMERRLPVDHVDLPAVLVAIATLRQQAGRSSGMPYLDRAIRIQVLRMGPEDTGTAFLRYQMTSQLLTNGDPARARIEGERAIAVIRKAMGETHPDLPRYTRALGILAMNDGDHSSARRHFEATLALTLSHQPVDSLAIARTHTTLSELRNNVGDYESALTSAQLAIRLQRGRIMAANPMYSRPFVQAGRALAALGFAAEASASLDSAFTSFPGDSSLDSYHVLARAYAVRASGDTAAALAWSRRARELGRKSLDPTDSYQAEAARFHADALVDAGRPEQVVRELGEAVAAAAERYGPSHPAVTRMRLSHARALAATHDPSAVEAALSVAASRREDLLALASGFSEQEALFVARRDGLGLDPLLALAADGRLDAGSRGAALAAVASARGLVLETIAARSRELRLAATPVARAALDSLAQARSELARSMVRAPSALIEPDSAMRASRSEVRRWEQRMSDLVVGISPTRAIGVAELSGALAPDEALVSFFSYRTLGVGVRESDRMIAFVARPGRPVEARDLAAAGDIESLVMRWRDAAAPGGTRKQAQRTGDSLRHLVWDRVAPLVEGASRVVIVADGPLHMVDFALLPAARGGWLIEQGALLARLSSERDLLLQPREARGVPLVVGAPDFERSDEVPLIAASFRGARSSCARFSEVHFEPLPGARAEGEIVVERLIARGESPRWLTGEAATEAAFKQAAEGASSLHLATHGFLLGEACGAGSGLRGVGRLVPAARRNPVAGESPDLFQHERVGMSREHPMRLAGLALAGANRRGDAAADAEDGILTSEEISALDLSGVGEVVLSACDTGTGEVAVGEGVFGLQRAFKLAGAGSLVMSLWPVRDEDAKAWMGAYYGARGQGRSVPEAVRSASRTRLAAIRAAHGDEHPSRWAGFIAVGR